MDYKILSKVLDNRLKDVVLDKIIEPCQTGFMEGRFILTNVLKLMTIMDETSRKKMTGLVMAIDFEKCFHMIEHCAIRGKLQYFGFGPKYIKWVMLLFTNFEVCTQNNGYVSEWLKPTRGLHQGCCISPHLYLLMGQLFADLFSKNKEITGIQLHNIMNLLSQFADDTNIYLKNADKLREVSQTLKVAENSLGLKVNYDKTMIYRIGASNEAIPQRYMQTVYAWNEPPIHTLGIDVINDPEKMLELNLKPVSQQVDTVLKTWGGKRLTLMA